VHLDFENWIPILLEQESEYSQVYRVKRMVPRNKKIKYFFTNPDLFQISINSQNSYEYWSNNAKGKESVV
jgi:hypothetical protein